VKDNLAGGGAGWGRDGAVAAFASLVVEEGFEEAGAVEIGPESFGDEDFGVGDLPEEEIGDAHFSRGADEEVGIGKIAGVEVAGEFVFGDGMEDGVRIMAVLGIWRRKRDPSLRSG